jgi:hypothetical protein
VVVIQQRFVVFLQQVASRASSFSGVLYRPLYTFIFSYSVKLLSYKFLLHVISNNMLHTLIKLHSRSLLARLLCKLLLIAFSVVIVSVIGIGFISIIATV